MDIWKQCGRFESFFEIDHSGSWHYEIGDQNCHFYLAVSGPTEIQSHWSKN